MQTIQKKIVTKITQTALPAPLMPTHSITVDAKKWKEYNKLQTRYNAIKKQVDALREEMKVDSNTIKDTFGEHEQVIVIVDGNGAALGKASVFHKAGFEMPATWQVRVS